ncbi:unnamed protein product [Arctogadus glacialis]
MFLRVSWTEVRRSPAPVSLGPTCYIRTRIYPPSPQRGDFSFQKDMEMHTSCALNFTFAVVNVQKLGMNRIP